MLGPYPGDIGTAYCPVGTTPVPILDPSGGVVGWNCVDTSGISIPPVVAIGTVPIGVTVLAPVPRPTGPTLTVPNRPAQSPGPAQPPRPPPTIPVIVGPQLFGNFPVPVPVAPVVESGGGTTVSGDLGAEGPIYVNTSQVVNVADSSAANAVSAVASAVQGAIGAAASRANQVAQQTASDIQNSLSQTATQISNGVNTAFSNIGGVINGIETGVSSTLGGIGATIAGSLASTLNPIASGLGAIIQVITGQIGGLAGQIGQAVGAVIPAIVAAVTGAASPAQAVLIAIQGEIRNSVAAISQLGSDVSGGFGSLDATLGRTLSDWESYNTTFVESQTGWGTGSTAHSDLSSIANALAGLIASFKGVAAPKLSDVLTTSCGGADLNDLLNKPIKWPEDMPSLWQWYGGVITSLLLWAAEVFPAVQKVIEVARQNVDRGCPTGLLSPADLVDAELRGFLTNDQTTLEASKGNISPTRYQTLKDLATHQMTPGELVEALYRNIIQPNDFASALNAQGWTAGQQNLLQALAVPRFNVASGAAAEELLRRGLIDNSAFDTILKSLNYDDAQRKALIALVFRPAGFNEALEGGATADELGSLGVPQVAQIPEYIQVAGASEGLSQDAISQRWAAHWRDGGVQTWLTLYFRGQATLASLQAVMDRSFIPRGVQTAVIEANRPIPQFRSLGVMYRWGILTYDGLIQQLKRHGFSDLDATTLANFYKTEGPLPAAKRAATQHSVSLSIAKEEYIDGSISEQDYYQILLAHGFTIEGANAEIALENTRQAMLVRKQNAQLVVDEYGSGLINEQQALAQLAALGLTVNELAKYTHKIRAFKVRTAKQPSESDLNHFLQLQIISPADYVAALQTQGYSEKWAQSFLAWRVHPSSSASTSPAAITTVP